ncbi:nucleoside deaminase [archaeon]|nr:nucleoside deaminase [archaeon]MBT3451610.1 nucleoside deaminase [archaeon]MBT6869631.1 nucleoside deaminase [archaeon]MBT7380200.1 nucleoside deaminase [archaeon]MBT7508652.1 nucleoside deaminase [archaeon]
MFIIKIPPPKLFKYASLYKSMNEDLDHKYMRLAIEEAKISLQNGDYPVGAVLVINDKITGKKRNCLHSKEDWASHAESMLIRENSKLIKSYIKNDLSDVILYTTLEPCLMCLGTSVLHRISKIVYACPDPHGGATKINPKELTDWYVRKWPEIKGGLYKEEVYDLMIDFMKKQNTKVWDKIRVLYEDMNSKW